MAASLYFHHDDLFSATAISAGPLGVSAGGAFYGPGDVIERYEYGDFGTPNPAHGQYYQSPIGNRFMFTGREWDTEVQMYHYRTRYMLPDWGRFTTRDSIGIWGDPYNVGNPYTLVANAPSSWGDPFGISSEEPFHHIIPKFLGGGEGQPRIKLPRVNHIDLHKRLMDLMDPDRLIRRDDHDRFTKEFERLSPAQRRDIIRKSLSPYVRPDSITDDLLDQAFKDFQPGQNRADEPRAKRFPVYDPNTCSMGTRFATGAVVFGAIATIAQTAQAADILEAEQSCQRMLRAAEAFGENPSECKILQNAANDVAACALELSTRIGGPGGLRLYKDLIDNWYDLISKCTNRP